MKLFNETKSKIIGLFLKENLKFTLISIFIGFLIGSITLAVAGFNPFRAYAIMFSGVFGRLNYIAWVIIRSTPLILTGLSIAFAFKTGLFNIGAEGQFIIGALVAALAGYFIQLPAILHIPVVILLAASAAALWGGIAGYLKAKFGVHEVIATIMLNWIALYLTNFVVTLEAVQRPARPVSHNIQPTASLMFFQQWKVTEEGRAWLLDNFLAREILRTPFNAGILFAVILAVVVWYILKHTTLGYELKAVGLNKHAAEYAGINVQKNIVRAMLISGALAGMAGAFHVLGNTQRVAILAAMEGFGFNGIAVALIGGSTAIGVVFSALLFGALQYGGTKIQLALGAPTEVINIMIGTIVFFIAIPRLIKILLAKFSKKRGEDNA
ncbi:MAG: ABC transporter permease [Alkaliphilus sp.]|nr:ABC transporter permease [Alkaliphilus sp. AH-315-G20]PHS32803.1 MAG: ABC transporter permease [Alkaliphilus sp.]